MIKVGHTILLTSDAWIMISLMISAQQVQAVDLCTNDSGPNCNCTFNNNQLEVDCKEKSMTKVPVGIQQNVSTL